MLTKFETKSNRVKGLAFHPSRPWILASLHNGVIQLWDYRMGTLLERFDEHDGPVRGVDFHASQPLFVSGGDDYKIKVWNYRERRCLFTLVGHLDYIRTVQFHWDLPWIVSASDDQTVRISNWQNRTCVTVLTGHNHYVMCASFHPREDLLVSASLDQTVRVWDISGLRKKNSAGRGGMGGGGGNGGMGGGGGNGGMGGMGPGSGGGGMGPGGGGDDGAGSLVKASLNADIFGSSDAIVKFVLEGHDRGVNWASFHPTLPLIVSGADDRQIILWRMNEAKAWEVDTLRGHVNNVSCVLFHPREEIIVSNSEDKSIRVWDMSKRQGAQTFRREHDRFWILAAHPKLNLLAAGHDNGMVVFKLERERPAHFVHGDALYYVGERFLRVYDFSKGREQKVMAVRRAGAAGPPPRSLSYNVREGALLVNSDADGGSYELLQVPADAGSGGSVSEAPAMDAKRGLGSSAVFIARNRFAVLDKMKTLLIKNLKNEVTKRCPPPYASTDACFEAAKPGLVLLRSEERMTLYDVTQRRVVGTVVAPQVKYVVWNADGTRVAMLSKHAIVVATGSLKHVFTVHETIRVKSGAWDSSGVFVYSTLNHLKYCLPNGDHGIIRTLEVPLYVTSVAGSVVRCLDRDAKIRVLKVDRTEYAFKLALVQKRYDEVARILRGPRRLCGEAIVSYLQRKGYAEVALHFVRDDKIRLDLSLECGNVEVALECAKRLNDDECWNRLAVEALRQGNHQVVEMAYQHTRNYERLSFLYLITGNIENLRRMLKIAEKRGDVMSRFHNALLSGDVGERCRVLMDVGHPALALVLASTHGLDEVAAKARATLRDAWGCEDDDPRFDALAARADADLLAPPVPLLRAHDSNWPLLTVSRGFFDGMSLDAAAAAGGTAAGVGAGAGAGAGAAAAGGLGIDADDDLDGADVGGGGWGDDLDDMDDDGLGGGGAGGGAGGDLDGDLDDDDLGGGGGGWDVDDVALPDIPAAAKATTSGFVPPTSGVPVAERWSRAACVAGDHVAAGQLEAAFKALRSTIAIRDFAPLKPAFLTVAAASQATMTTLAGAPPVRVGLCRNPDQATPAADNSPSGGEGAGNAPRIAVSVAGLVEKLKASYKLMTGGKFNDALNAFLSIMYAIPLVVVDTRGEVNDVKELLKICREYVIAIRLELKRKTVKEDPARGCQLAALFTHCQLQPIHLMLSLQVAMMAAYKIKNFGMASSFARRLVELNPKPEVAAKATKVVNVCQANPTDEHPFDYDDRNPFVVCSASLEPIYRGSPVVRCLYCGASYRPEFKGILCKVCEIAEVGAEGPGLTVSQSQLQGRGAASGAF